LQKAKKKNTQCCKTLEIIILRIVILQIIIGFKKSRFEARAKLANYCNKLPAEFIIFADITIFNAQN
jgi:hypothetical protein